MKYYLATSLSNSSQHNQVRDVLSEFGAECTYDWTKHGPVWQEGASRCEEVSLLEVAGVTAAEVVIVLLPGGRGTHVELGLALADPKKIILLCGSVEELGISAKTCAFYYHPQVIRLRYQTVREIALRTLLAGRSYGT